jgi:hypothetical protein
MATMFWTNAQMDWLLISEKSSGIRCDSAMLHILVDSEGQQGR